MVKKISKLQIAQNKAEKAITKTNEKINILGKHTSDLYYSLQELNDKFNKIKNVSKEYKMKYEKLQNVRLNWKQQVEKIEQKYKDLEIKQLGQIATGIAGVGVATLGPTAAMGIATTFGVASTGTAISTLSGAAATNAALAWLGGGALAVGGSGMTAGNTLLASAGPIGWTIASVSIITSGIMLFKTKANKENLENIFIHISNRDIKSYELATIELNERIEHIKRENKILIKSSEKIETFGIDYKKMNEKQQYELGSYVNLMEASTMLLVNPIIGLQQKYSEKDYKEYYSKQNDDIKRELRLKKFMIMSLANLLYNIELDDNDKKILYKSLKNNNEFLKSIRMSKNRFKIEDITFIQEVLKIKYDNIKSNKGAVL